MVYSNPLTNIRELFLLKLISMKSFLIFVLSMVVLLLSIVVQAHGVDDITKQFLIDNKGPAVVPFLYFGAKHMITGYDHLLFLAGVVFFLFKTRDVIIYVSLFTIGHSFTLFLGVLGNIVVNPYLIDAVIGFSVVYKGFDNLGGFKKLFNFQPNTKIAVGVFGLFHGFGLATKLQELNLSNDGLITNLIAFNVGVEIGQILALIFILIGLSLWRQYRSFLNFSVWSNSLLMVLGWLLVFYQLFGYIEAI